MVKYKNIFGDDFQLNQCHVNTSLGLVGGMHPLHPPCVRACLSFSYQNIITEGTNMRPVKACVPR